MPGPHAERCTTADAMKSCITQNKEYTRIPMVYGPSGNAGFISSTVWLIILLVHDPRGTI